MFAELNISRKFVFANLPIRGKKLSRFHQTTFLIYDNTPPMPLYDAHLGGFFFYNTENYGKEGLR